MKKIFYLSLLGFVLIFSCKEKVKKNNIASDTISVSSKDKIKSEVVGQEAKIINTNFAKIQELADKKSDTLYITNYWATWCPPCVKEIPDFVTTQEEYKDKKVKFIFVSVDETDTQSQVLPFAQKNNMKNVYHISLNELKSNIGSIDPELAGGIPVTIIQKGNMREGFLGDVAKNILVEKIEKYLKK